MAMRSCSQVVQERRFRTFFWSKAKNDSIAALSPRGADSPNRSDHAVMVQGSHEAACSKLRSAVGVKYAVGDVVAPGDSVVQRVDGQAGFHL
jgi:hypothetical protein